MVRQLNHIAGSSSRMPTANLSWGQREGSYGDGCVCAAKSFTANDYEYIRLSCRPRSDCSATRNGETIEAKRGQPRKQKRDR